KSVSARVFDPLWLLARQWQLGEFQGEDAGTPVSARVRSTSALLSRCHLGELPNNTNEKAPRYDPLTMPLEVMVERRRMRANGVNDLRMLSLSVEAGLHFLRMLESQPLAKSYRAGFVAKFALQALTGAQAGAADEGTRRFVQSMAGRAPDARLLSAAFRGAGAAQVAQDSALQIAEGDRAEVQQAAVEWLGYYNTLFSEPGAPTEDAWLPSRMEYAVSVAAGMSADATSEVLLTANEFDDGRLDWSSFDVSFESNIGSAGDRTFAGATETTIPAPVTFRGAPAARFWELEDARIAYGLVPVGPTDLAKLLMIEYVGSYGNDWFVVPLTLPVGSVTSIDSLVVTDSFGVRSLLRPIDGGGLPAQHWSMWRQSAFFRPGEAPIGNLNSGLFFLPPSLGRVMEGSTLEDVLLMRDEMANVAWAIERNLESALEQALPGYSAPPATAVAAASTGAGVPTSGASAARYLLSSTVPDNWIPLLPVELQGADGKVISRLKRGAVLQPDGSQKVHRAQGQVLNAAGELLLYDEEVPREGVHVTRSRRMARWLDGSTWVWAAYKKQVGRGEGSSNLQFDQLLEPGTDQSS
ncbi:MAG: hypothetical protein ABI612_19300, partial [Betaproteobacteria bacterium]